VILADIDANDWVVIIAAVVTGLSSLISAVASAVVYVRQRLLASNVQKIELATNSMKDALVKAAGEAGEARGGMAERGRADARKVADDTRKDERGTP
jgi:uncharacterized membrane protein